VEVVPQMAYYCTHTAPQHINIVIMPKCTINTPLFYDLFEQTGIPISIIAERMDMNYNTFKTKANPKLPKQKFSQAEFDRVICELRKISQKISDAIVEFE
jgi:hypothetical protein